MTCKDRILKWIIVLSSHTGDRVGAVLGMSNYKALNVPTVGITAHSEESDFSLEQKTFSLGTISVAENQFFFRGLHRIIHMLYSTDLFPLNAKHRAMQKTSKQDATLTSEDGTPEQDKLGNNFTKRVELLTPQCQILISCLCHKEGVMGQTLWVYSFSCSGD